MFPLRAWYLTSTRSPPLPYRRICARLVARSRNGPIDAGSRSAPPPPRGSWRTTTRWSPSAARAAPRPRPATATSFGSTRSGSISSREPSPVQSGQAPCGELKVKFRGAGSSNEPPCSGQAYLSLKSRSCSFGGASGRLTSRSRRRTAAARSRSSRPCGWRPAAGCRRHRPAHDQAVDHDLDAVLVLLVELDLLVEVAQLAVDPHAHEAAPAWRRPAASRARPCDRGRAAPAA